MSMSRLSIPEKIQEEILLRLPVKSNLRFKSVCKSWYALLSSHEFARDHLSFAIKKNRKIMIRVGDDNFEDDDKFYSIDYASILSPSCKFDGAVVMDYPNDNNNNDITHSNYHFIVGSCNGLILLLAYDSKKLFLWNPLTREYKEIIRVPAPEESNLCFGFGYDAKTDNYKLVCIATGKSDDGELDDFSEVYLYTAGSWSRLQNIPYSDVTGGVLLNGALHWLGEETIISFDTHTEKFMDFPLPKETMTCPDEKFSVQVLGGFICLICGVPNARVDVWVMQNYGVGESWTKQFTSTQERITADPRSLKLYGSVKDSEILIQVRERLGLYDQKNDDIRMMDINGMNDGCFFFESYVESLVSVNSGSYMGAMEEELSESKNSHLKKNSEVTMEPAAHKEAKRKRTVLAESSNSSKRKRISDENQ